MHARHLIILAWSDQLGFLHISGPIRLKDLHAYTYTPFLDPVKLRLKEKERHPSTLQGHVHLCILVCSPLATDI